MNEKDSTLDDLIIGGRKMRQPRQGYRMGLDAVLLSAFVSCVAGHQVADLGTGAGALPLLLTARYPGINVRAVEIQAELALLARENVLINGLSDQVTIYNQDLTSIHHQWGSGSFDLVVTNPPYRIPGSGGTSPNKQKRIATEEICCSLSDVITTSARLVSNTGTVALVHKPERLADIIREFTGNNLQPVRLCFVHPQQDKAASLILLEGRKKSKQALVVEPSLIVHEIDMSYTKEMQRIYYNKGDG